MSTEPASETVREGTVIDANYSGTGIKIGGNLSETIVEGFTIRHAGKQNAPPSSSRLPEPAAGIYLEGANAIIRYNLITENGTSAGNKSGRGIYLVNSN